MIPDLARCAPLDDAESRVLSAHTEVEQWARKFWLDREPPFYASVDLRHATFKLAPVDTNLFPGGFNNLNPTYGSLCVQAVMAAIERRCATARNLLLIPENHTRNVHYLRNLSHLTTILTQAGLDVRLGTLRPDVRVPETVTVEDAAPVVLEPLVRTGDRVGVLGFDPCAVLLNNDLSSGIPDILRGLERQPVMPPLHAGWAVRRKSNHFAAFDRIAAGFGELVGIDPWLVNPFWARCGRVDFKTADGEQCLADKVSDLLALIAAKYGEHGITERPYVVVKADAGTYGMGVMIARSPDDVVGLGRKRRERMAVGKEGLAFTEVLLQEGVHSHETVGGAVAEPVVYMIDRFVVGGFHRVHTARGKDENLNSPGQHFVPLPFDDCCVQPDFGATADAEPNRLWLYGVIARLALMAAALELEETAPRA